MTAVVFAALVWKVVDFLRQLANLKTQKSSVLTQLCAWVGGIAVVALGAHAAVSAALVLPGSTLPLGKLDFGSTILLGMLISSTASALVDVKQAIDGHDSAAKPSLLEPPASPTPQV